MSTALIWLCHIRIFHVDFLVFFYFDLFKLDMVISVGSSQKFAVPLFMILTSLWTFACCLLNLFCITAKFIELSFGFVSCIIVMPGAMLHWTRHMHHVFQCIVVHGVAFDFESALIFTYITGPLGPSPLLWYCCSDLYHCIHVETLLAYSLVASVSYCMVWFIMHHFVHARCQALSLLMPLIDFTA